MKRGLAAHCGMQPGVWSLAFNPSGMRLAAGSEDRIISNGAKPDAETLRQFLDDDLRQAFGTADRAQADLSVNRTGRPRADGCQTAEDV